MVSSAWKVSRIELSPAPTGQSTLDPVEGHVADAVAAPILVIEMPPFLRVHGEALRLHRLPQQLAVPALERCAAGILRICTVRALVVGADHLHRFPGPAVVEREIDGR